MIEAEKELQVWNYCIQLHSACMYINFYMHIMLHTYVMYTYIRTYNHNVQATDKLLTQKK